jgi:glutamate-1-semialdehyde 2,1-aminomutase
MTRTAPTTSARPTRRSAELFAAAQRVIPGGVNSPVRAFRSVGGTPRFIARAAGARLTDADGNEYIDYVLSWGAIALGHAHPAVVDALLSQVPRGTSYGAPTECETDLAETIAGALPSVEMVRFVSSGTEAAMSALRLARAATGRRTMIKFAGCYHGHADAFLVQAGSGAATLGLPDSPGVPPGAVADTVTVPYNDLGAVEAVFAAHPRDVAAVIVEPVAGNMGLVMPRPGFLDGLRRLTATHDAVLIFDEVMTGFRVGWGGAQVVFGVTPDLTCLGKIIGGGLPMAAYGGRAELMRLIAPAGDVYQAGTLSGNPLAMVAGLATLRQLARPEAYQQLSHAAASVAGALRDAATRAGVAIQTTSVGGMWGCFFTNKPVLDYTTAKTSDTAFYARVFHAALENGVYLAPSQFEAGFTSLAHDREVLAMTSAAFQAIFRSLPGAA